nr:tRNA (adenosine(37)-N6)-dimethylallyltransferase MiaA [Rubricella aquisinus]
MIAGPTASGKSALAMAVAARDGGVIVNADALQVYACWQVLTARPTDAETAQAPHRLYGHVGARVPYSTGRWLREVAAEIAAIEDAGQRPIIVGGTGLNFTALTDGLADIPETPPEIRAEGNALMARHGLAWFVEHLRITDPESLSRLDQNNPMRVQRAWEVLQATGRGIAAWHSNTPPPILPLTDCVPIALTPRPEWLNARIAQRFAAMLDQGAVEEVRRWIEAGHDSALPAAKAIGRAEITDWLNGHLTREEVIERGSIATRQYAKRQRTWIRNRFQAWQTLSPEDGLDAALARVPR